MHGKTLMMLGPRWAAVFCDAPNPDGGAGGMGGGGDTGQPVDGAGGPDESGASDHQAAAGAVDDDDSLEGLMAQDDPAELGEPLPASAAARIKALSAQNRKLMRRYEKRDPVYRRIKQLEAEGLTLDQAIEGARGLQRLQALADGTPEERAQLARMLRVSPEPAGSSSAAPAAKPKIEGLIDLENLPYDPNDSEINRHFYAQAQTINTLLTKIHELTQGHEGLQADRAKNETRARQAEWKNVIETGVASIEDEGMQSVVKDLMALAYRDQEQRRKQGLRTFAPAMILNTYLTKLGASKKVREIANLAVKARGAARTNNLPRGATNAGTPAGADAAARPGGGLAEARRRITAVNMA